MKKFLEKHWLAVLVIVGIVGIAATGVVIPYTQYTLQFLQSQNSGVARSLLGVTTTAANNTNQTLVTPTLQGGTGNTFTNNGAVDNYGTHNGGNFNSPTNNYQQSTGGNFNSPTNNYQQSAGGNFNSPTNNYQQSTGGNFSSPTNNYQQAAGGNFATPTNNYQQATGGNFSSPTNTGGSYSNSTFSGPSSFSGPITSTSTSNNIFATQLPFSFTNIYFISGFDNFTESVGSLILGWSFDGQNFQWLNDGNSLWNGIDSQGRGTTGFVADFIIYNGAAYIAYSRDNGGGTNVYLGCSTNLEPGSWNCIYVWTNDEPKANQAFASRLNINTNGLPFFVYTSSTNAGAAYTPYISFALDSTMTNWSSPLRVLGTNGTDMRSINDLDDFMPVWSGSQWIGIGSSLGLYGMVFTNTGGWLTSNWVYSGQIPNSYGTLLLGEGFNEIQAPNGGWNLYYDDGPNNATVGFGRVTNFFSAIPYNISSIAGSPVFDPQIPYVTGYNMPFRHPEIWLCSNVPPAMVPALVSSVIQPGVNWSLNPVSSPGYHLQRPTTYAPMTMTGVPSVRNSQPLNAGLILDCMLVEGSGTNVLDYSINALNGYIIGAPHWTNGLAGNSLALTNSAPVVSVVASLTNCVTEPLPPQCTNLSAFTFDTTFDQTNFSSGQPVLFWIGASGTAIAYGFGLYNNGWENFIQPASGTASVFNEGETLVNGWHHIAVTYDGSNVRTYVDGAAYSTDAYSSGVTNIFGAAGAQIIFGAMVAGGQEGAVRLWNRALTANEVKLLYRQSFPP